MPKKIGLIGFQHANNYGALLQLYAQKKYIESLGHTVSIINYKNIPVNLL